MRGLKSRVEAIEQADGDVPHTPAVKAWLGRSLTDAERKELAKDDGNSEPVDVSGLSRELKEWLGVH